mgnify:CR=1 FL=1
MYLSNFAVNASRRVTYADYTASGRALTFIEDYLRDAVLRAAEDAAGRAVAAGT